MGPLTEGDWKPSWSDHFFADVSVPLPSEQSIIIHSPPSSPPQEPPAKRLKIFIDKGKTVINLDLEPTPPPSPSHAPELKDIEVIESSIRPVSRHLPQIRAPPPNEVGPSVRRPSQPPPTSRSPPPTIGWIDSDPDDLPSSPHPQPVNDSHDSDGIESDPNEDSFPSEFYL
ncbi:pollen-specific leucine-rich repeat extensin-like protein 3 [Abrus precatorius]|uniref:Pollen-specific leucine-rich repeat extensin-like protein 3 n=1 Tax=Abrus precatorius TaxID=3816 RepID=A0A8B8L8X8_ABRPR|nr:pollen-specific leucine-rich repeat extensin-like protein 3 [Abrus precatorius]